MNWTWCTHVSAWAVAGESANDYTEWLDKDILDEFRCWSEVVLCWFVAFPARYQAEFLCLWSGFQWGSSVYLCYKKSVAKTNTIAYKAGNPS